MIAILFSYHALLLSCRGRQSVSMSTRKPLISLVGTMPYGSVSSRIESSRCFQMCFSFSHENQVHFHRKNNRKCVIQLLSHDPSQRWTSQVTFHIMSLLQKWITHFPSGTYLPTEEDQFFPPRIRIRLTFTRSTTVWFHVTTPCELLVEVSQAN